MAIPKFEYKVLRDRERWFAYFDLLGFTELVSSSHLPEVLSIYGEILEKLKDSVPDFPGIKPGTVLYSWFSDTFIIYSREKGANAFALIERISRLFFQRLILNEIPVRGALTFGGLYSQLAHNIFVGPALIDAYQHAENQDWLGFVLAPRALVQMSAVGLKIEERLLYRPVDGTYFHHPCAEQIYAFAYNNGSVSGSSSYLQPMIAMEKKAGPKHAEKYARTIAFIKANTTNSSRVRT